MWVDELEGEWKTALQKYGRLEMRFASEGLVLGAGTVLAGAADCLRDVTLDCAEPRLLALLAAAHQRPPSATGLRHLQKASERWRQGEDALALMHLALSGLDRLKHPTTDAKRLFLADRLLREGFPASTLVNALDLPESSQRAAKYSPDQPRVPAGDGRTSGQWTSGDETPSTPLTAWGTQARLTPSAAPVFNSTEQRTGASLPTSTSDTSDSTSSVTAGSRAISHVSVRLPSGISGSPPPQRFDVSWYTDAVKAVADATEVTNSIAKWRELGPKGEAAIVEAIEARGWIVLGTQVRVRTSIGLRIEDFMVRVPAGTAGNAATYDGFIEVKVNGGRYSATQRLKDSIIGTSGGTLLSPVLDPKYHIGKNIKLETGLAHIDITYEVKVEAVI